MDSNQKESFRLAILQVLDVNRTRFGLAPTAIRLHLPQFGFPGADVESVREEIEYLTNKGLAEEVMKAISRENRCWRISDKGIAFLDAYNG